MSSDKTRECDFCTYEWIARVSSPKSCPRCKRRFDYQEAKLVLEKLGRRYDFDLTGIWD